MGLAPPHNPANYAGIEVAERVFAQARQVAAFDTAFHHTLPKYAFRYALPTPLYTEQRIRRYGFHGTSHQYVAAQAAAYLNKPDAKLITVRLGNGCSMAAARGSQSLGASMGVGPLAGLAMGTRSGDVDPSGLLHLLGPRGYTTEQITDLLDTESGVLGLTGASGMRDVGAALAAGDGRAALAYNLYAYRIRQYVGAYAAVLNGLNGIVFTAGAGENNALVRSKVCQNMAFFGVALDEAKNKEHIPGLRELNQPKGRAKILVIPTAEELEIAQQCAVPCGTAHS